MDIESVTIDGLWRRLADTTRELDELRAVVAKIAEHATLPEIADEESLCPDCGSMVDWRDAPPDIGDCVVCDTCAQQRLSEIIYALAQAGLLPGEAGGE